MVKVRRCIPTAGIAALAISIVLVLYVSFGSYMLPETTLNPFAQTSVQLDRLPQLNTSNVSEGNIPRILLVSAFFPLSQSKHSLEDYASWMKRFLGPITTDVYFFTTPGVEPMIHDLRDGLPLTVNTSFPSPFAIPPLRDFVAQYEEMHEWDRERARHSPELYATWNAKAYFLEEGLRNLVATSGVEYDYAFWSDAGSFRDEHVFSAWPDGARVEDVFAQAAQESGTPKDELIFLPIWNPPETRMRFWTEEDGPIDNEFSEGSFFGGAPAAIAWYRNLFYTYHDAYRARDLFVGKDQTLINALLTLFPSRFATVWLFGRDDLAVPLNAETPHGSCGST
ncbi:hypothetical protein EWM64_g3208, partial [Hericium alpestre]